MPLTGAITPAPATTRAQAYSLSASREKYKHIGSRLGLDGTAKKEEHGIAVTSDVGKPRWWLLIQSSTLSTEGNGIYEYTVDVYESALGKESSGYLIKFAGITMKARNSCESDNTGTRQAGHVVNASGTACTDIIAIKPVPKMRVPCWDVEQISGTDAAAPANWRFVFSWQNAAKYYGEPA